MKTLLMSGLLALALPATAAGLEVRAPWAKATLPGQPVSGAYLELRADSAARLVKVDSPLAETVEIHEMKMDGGMMKMRALPALELPAGQTVTLKPGGLHIMLMQLKGPLKAGGKLPLTLHVEQDGKTRSVAVEADIRAMAAH